MARRSDFYSDVIGWWVTFLFVLFVLYWLFGRK